MRKRLIIIPILLIIAVSAVAYWYMTTQNTQPATTGLTGSGTVEVTTVTISPESFGRVAAVAVQEGDLVNTGDRLFELDASLLSAQLDQATTSLKAAQAGLSVAQDGYAATEAGVNIAQAQYDLTLAQALQAAQPTRSIGWRAQVPEEFEQPEWYYTQAEKIKAALDELNSAKASLEAEQTAFNALMAGGVYVQLTDVENRLSIARAAFVDAQVVLNRASEQEFLSLIDAAQEAYDAARDELEAAQTAYNELLASQEATTDILDERARLAIAQERYDTAQDSYNVLQTGRDALAVQVPNAALIQAQTNVTLAESKLAQAQAAIDQAQAAVDLINVQMAKLVITSPMAGVVLARNVEPGEVIQPGAAALSLGDLQNLSITVYLSEDRYGEVKLGEQAQVSVDSFPGRSFSATVTRIADQAEFTPRNVQTTEGRSSTVYAIQLKVADPDGLLKPGMPADVRFTQP
jgi:multidrug resistance efflux pump